MRIPTYLLANCLLLTLVSITFGNEGDWTRFRGSQGNGQAQATGLPLSWSDDENLLWKTELPGPGASSPVVFQGRMYLTCYSGYGTNTEEPGEPGELKRHLLCLDARDGTVIWDAPLASTNEQKPYQGFIALHGYASSTPAVDESGIYVFYGTTGAVAYDFAGNVRWQVGLGTGTHAFGTANSPVIEGELVILNASVECGDLVALKKGDGSEAWRVKGIDRSWNTPLVYDSLSGQREVVVNTQGRIRAFNPVNGEAIWDCGGIDDYICPSIIAEEGVLFAIGARRSTIVAVNSGGHGDVTETHLLWRENRGSNVSSPVYHDGYLFWAKEDRGIFYCANAETGELVYEERLEPSPGRIYASPTVVDGKIYYVSREKGVIVLPARPEFEILAQNVFASDKTIFNASPVVVDNHLILRSDKAVYCLGK